jgi:hypothetical protein
VELRLFLDELEPPAGRPVVIGAAPLWMDADEIPSHGWRGLLRAVCLLTDTGHDTGAMFVTPADWQPPSSEWRQTACDRSPTAIGAACP